MNPSTDSPAPAMPLASPKVRPTKATYVPALGPWLRTLLWTIFASVAFLGASGVYLGAISFLNWWRDPQTYTSSFTLWMFFGHSAIGVAATVPFIGFGLWHMVTARKRPNRAAVRKGMILFTVGTVICLTGVALIQLEGLPQLSSGSASRNAIYWAHILIPFLGLMSYVWHRQAGPRIRWRFGYVWGGGVVLFVGGMMGLHMLNPHEWYQTGPAEGVQYFFPSEARTADGKFIPAETLMADEYCMKCHQDIYNDHLHSAHKFSSFNNPPYLFSVLETRKVAMERDGNVKASRWCAGCHDPVPFFSGAFDDPNFKMEESSLGHAGITCTACHAMTNVNSTAGNASYTIENPEHYPFAFSKNETLQYINNQMVKAKPDFHKKTFLKDFHKSAKGDKASEFCSTCHKVALPAALNHYKEFLRGQNHYDSFLLSGVSGHGSRAFYYPPEAKTNCNDCHMPLKPSTDFGAKDFDGSGEKKVHSHFFPGGNTGLFSLLKNEPKYSGRSAQLDQSIQKEVNYLKGVDPEGKDKKLRIDLFGVKTFGADGQPDDNPPMVIRPTLPTLEPGKSYSLEVVVRTVAVGHHFSQGTVDSNEIWVDLEAKNGGKVIARSGGMKGEDDSGEVDPWSHFINVHMLDRHGNRIDRRNPQNIFTPLYDKQVPPGAGQVIHYRLNVPADATEAIEVRVRLRYRKFDQKYMEYVHAGKAVPKLPVVDIAQDEVILPLKGGKAVAAQESPIKPAWQRWNDYGIGCLNEGGVGMRRGNLKMADLAFAKLTTLGVPDAIPHGWLNRARVAFEQARLKEAAEYLRQAQSATPPAPWWTVAWFNALVTLQNATTPEDFDSAIGNLESIVDPAKQVRERKFDFSKDYVVLAQLGSALFRRSQLEGDNPAAEREFLRRSAERFSQALTLDSEDLDSHYGLKQVYERLSIRVDLPPMSAGEVTVERLKELAKAATSGGANAMDEAAALSQALTSYGRIALNPQKPRLPVLREMLPGLRSAFVAAQGDRGLQDALAASLATLHRELHLIFKPDDIARAKTTREYRAKNPAANAAAEAIVIYPTDRDLPPPPQARR